MIAQLSHMAPRGSPDSWIVGVRCEGFICRNSGDVVLPQTSTSSKSRPAARTKMRTVRLFTLGFRTCSVMSAMVYLLGHGVAAGLRYGFFDARSSDSEGR